MSKNTNQRISRWPTILAVSLVVIAIALNWMVPLYLLGNWNDRSAFGQLFGPATALFTGVGIAGVLHTIRLQQQQIREAEQSQAETQKTIENQLRMLTEQTAILAKSLIVEAQSSVADRQLHLDRMLVEYADVRECFMERVTLGRGDPRYPRVMAVCQCLANYFDTYLLQKGNFAQLYSDEAWADYISGHFARSPMLSRFVVDHSNWYTPDLAALASATRTQAYTVVPGEDA